MQGSVASRQSSSSSGSSLSSAARAKSRAKYTPARPSVLMSGLPGRMTAGALSALLAHLGASTVDIRRKERHRWSKQWGWSVPCAARVKFDDSEAALRCKVEFHGNTLAENRVAVALEHLNGPSLPVFICFRFVFWRENREQLDPHFRCSSF